MVPDFTLLTARQRSRPFGHGTGRSPILVLGNDGIDGATSVRLVEDIAGRTVHRFVQQGRPPIPGGDGRKGGSSLPLAWIEARKQFPTVCVGLVAERGAGIAEASTILVDYRGGGAGPGAMVLLGFSHDFAATCLSLAGDLGGTGPAGGGAGSTPSTTARHDPFEWPPMMILMPEDDALLGDCALACRRMRSVGVPIHLEVMRSGCVELSEAALDDLVGELDGFFATHLVPIFPKRL